MKNYFSQYIKIRQIKAELRNKRKKVVFLIRNSQPIPKELLNKIENLRERLIGGDI